MRLVFPKTILKEPEENILKKAGYAKFVDPITKKTSFVRRFGTFFYPRFHVYIETDNEKIVFDLHIDQKKVSYEGSTKHSGEYVGKNVSQELHRIKNFLNQ